MLHPRFVLVLALLLALVLPPLGLACAPAQEPPNELAAPAVSALATATAADDAAAIGALLTEDAFVVDGGARFDGAAAASAQLAGQALVVRSVVDSHHDVLRALVSRGDDELLLFGRLDGALLTFVVLVAQPGEGVGDNGTDELTAYQAAWNEGDAAARDEQLATSWSDDGRFVDPTADVTGRDALAEHIAAFRDSLPGAAVVGTSDIVAGGGSVHFRWLTTGLLGLVSLEGMDVGLLDDEGRLALIAGFFGPLTLL